MSQQVRTFWQSISAIVLFPFAILFFIGSFLRVRAYELGFLKKYKSTAQIISIGNLTCGGTGKTPTTIDLAQRFTERGTKVAILSRGYHRKSRERVIVASDGEGHFANPDDCGDEPYMMAHAVPRAVVLVGAERSVTATIATELYNCDTLILDDGFQHLALARNEDIVLIDYHNDPLTDSILPSGRLREPINALSRASWVVITKLPKIPDPKVLSHFESLVNKYAPQAKLTYSRFIPSGLKPFGNDGAHLELDVLRNARVTAFSGIAHPKHFFNSLKDLGANLVRTKSFPDHHWYSKNDLELLKSDALTSNSQLIVTTEKDAVRLHANPIKGIPIYVLELSTQWLGPIPLIQNSVLPSTAVNSQPANLQSS